MKRGCRTKPAGFAQALTDFYKPLRGQALRLTKSLPDADDLVQETMLRALENAGRFKPGTNLRAWLSAILRNLFIDQVRSARRMPTVEAVQSKLARVRPELVTEQARSDVVADAELREHVDALSEPFRTAVKLFYFERKSYEEIARFERTHRTTVGVRLYRARKRLARALRPPVMVYIRQAELRARVW